MIQQVGTPQEVFDHPANRFVAGFIGTPQMNFYDAELLLNNGVYEIEIDGVRIVPSEDKQERLKARGVKPQSITLGVRPEHIALLGDGSDMLKGTVEVTEMMGSAVHLHVNACGKDSIIIAQTASFEGKNPVDFSIGSPISFTFGGNVIHMFSKEDERNLEFD